jgi:hypothetical protein
VTPNRVASKYSGKSVKTSNRIESAFGGGLAPPLAVLHFGLFRNPVALIAPGPEVNQLAALAAKRPPRVVVPRGWLSACWAVKLSHYRHFIFLSLKRQTALNLLENKKYDNIINVR